MNDLTPLRYKLSIQYFTDIIKGLFKSKKKEKLYGYIKFKTGDLVKITIISEIPEFWYIGKILDINARYVVPSIESSWKVEYYISFDNSSGEDIRYWILESELKKYDLVEERNLKIEEILNK